MALSTVTATAAGGDDRWALCPADTYVPTRPAADPASLEPGATEVRADQAQYLDDGPSTFTGNVEVIRSGEALRAESLRYDPDSDLATFAGAARFWGPGVYWEGVRGDFDFGRRTGELVGGRYQLLDRRGHGEADTIGVDLEENLTRLQQVDYTTCPGAQPAWRISASSITLDHDADWGRARNMVFRIRETPVLYLPFMSFPLSDKRKSGFLPPTFGSSTDSGADVSVPYYWNLHPARDLTIVPRFLGDRGVLLGGEFRYLLRSGEGRLEGEILPSDNQFEDRTRALFAARHFQYTPDRRGYVDIVFNHVSDKEYFEDFGTSLNVASTRFLEQSAFALYRGNRWLGWLRLQNFQNVDSSLRGFSGPYKRLPQMFFTTLLPQPSGRLAFRLQAETTYFEREDSVTGGRIDLRPALLLPWRTAGTFLIPSLELRHTQYLLDGNTLGDDRLDRTVPVASVDAGLVLERSFGLFGTPVVQTLEPRAFYVYIPEVEQDDIPRFDTGEFDFSFRQIFRPDRFSGRDRVGDTHQVSLGVETKILETATGFERLRAGIGQIYFIEDREVALLPGRPPITDSVSELVGDVHARITRDWSTGATLQWDPNADQKTRKASLRLRYRSEGGPIINMEYRIRRARTNIEQTDLSFYWPVSRSIGFIGRWNYSLEDQTTLESVGGVEYESCCWAIRAAARRFLSTADGNFDTGIFLQVEFKGLAGLGRQTESFFRHTVPGYEREF